MRLIDADVLSKATCSGGICSECEDRFNGNNVVTNCSEVRFRFLQTIARAPTITPWNIPNEESGWIPCNERLPEENGRYLVTFQERTIDICWFENKHFRIFGEIKDKFVSAWMPLPKLYKSENS